MDGVRWSHIDKESKPDYLQDGGISMQFKDSDGEISMVKHTVFPGVKLLYNEKHLPYNAVSICDEDSNSIMIDYCFEGELECRVGNDWFYVSSGDLVLSRLHSGLREELFPTNEYRGITIWINLNECPKSLNCILPDVDVEPADIVRKFHLDQKFSFTLRQIPAVSYIFSGLYDLSNSMKKKRIFQGKSFGIGLISECD